jgi:hypothetical protein
VREAALLDRGAKCLLEAVPHATAPQVQLEQQGTASAGLIHGHV